MPKQNGIQKCPKLNLRNRVFQSLEQDILNGKYPSGTNLTEKDLCEEFGVSRTPLREALCQLELEGLVECIPNKGAVVLGISEQDVNDIYTIKLTLDGLAARLAAERITPEELTDLEETVNLTEFYVNKDDINKVLELDSRFHDIICRAGKNRPLRSMMSNFHNFLKMARHKSLNNPDVPRSCWRSTASCWPPSRRATPSWPATWPLTTPTGYFTTCSV